MIKAWILMLVILSSSVLANTENVINVDRAIPNSLHLAFPNDANITPKKGDFNVLNYILMSNNEGERWAVITLTNNSTMTILMLMILIPLFIRFTALIPVV